MSLLDTGALINITVYFPTNSKKILTFCMLADFAGLVKECIFYVSMYFAPFHCSKTLISMYSSKTTKFLLLFVYLPVMVIKRIKKFRNT